ncbi:MAG: S41 family peptidase [Saprospiraceae bacterium]|nr:S41 family peptidase [Saprospiraceae bacterium]
MKTLYFVILLLLLNSNLFAQQFSMAQAPETPPLTKEERADIINSIGDLFESNYVFPDKGKAVKTKLNEIARKDTYKDISQIKKLLEQLTTDIQAIIHDSHFNLLHIPATANMNWVQPGDSEEDKKAAEDETFNRAKLNNFGITKAEILEGNIGYLNLSSFNAPLEGAKPQLAAAFNMLQHTKALIVDMRQNTGGLPEYVSLAESYFFEKPTLINTIYNRTENTTTKFTTLAEPGGAKYLGKEVYVLTGPTSASGGESFPYDLQAFKKATIIGEKTVGGAHGFTPVMLNLNKQGNVAVLMPDMREENVITKSNWEGVGVQPDIPVSAKFALETAHKKALEKLMQGEKSETQKTQYQSLVTKIDYQIQKMQSGGGAKNLQEYAGNYGIRTVSVENDELMFSRENGPKIKMIESGKETYDLDIAVTPKPRVRFARDAQGKINGFYLIQNDGNEVFNERKN